MGYNRSTAFAKFWEGPFDISITQTNSEAAPEAADQIDDFNAKITEWQVRLKSSLAQNIKMNGIGGWRLSRSLKPTSVKDFGKISRIGFSFLREGIFVHKGVGRGYVMNGDSVVKTSENAAFVRHPKPWFNPVIERYIPELDAIIKANSDTNILNTYRIFIR